MLSAFLLDFRAIHSSLAMDCVTPSFAWFGSVRTQLAHKSRNITFKIISALNSVVFMSFSLWRQAAEAPYTHRATEEE